MDITDLLADMRHGPLQAWVEQLPAQVAKGMDLKRYGDLPRWQAAVNALPQVHPAAIDLNTSCIQIGEASEVDAATQEHIAD